MIFSRKTKLLALCVIMCMIVARGEHLQFYLDEVRSLSDLPMSKLIEIKSNLVEDVALDEIDQEEGMESRTALALPMYSPYRRADQKSIRRGGDHWDEKGKGDTKVSKIFQLAITTLSFLAFGGYLLTLIITAIRRNALATVPGNVIVFSNLQNLNRYKRPKRNAVIFDPMQNDFDTDKFYRGMVMLSEGYASYVKLK